MNFTNLEDISWLTEIVKQDSPNSYYYDVHIIYDRNSVTFPSSSVAALIFFTSVWLNILILILTVLNLEKVYVWISVEESHSNLKDLYKASAGVLTFINLAAVGGDLSAVAMFYLSFKLYYDNDATYVYSVYLTLKLFLVALIMITDLVVSCLSTCKHNKRRLHQILHALALCQIIWFVHRLAADAIISVIIFIIAPAQTLGTVTLLLSTVVCAILFVSSLLKKGCRRCSKEVFCTLLVAICTTGLIVTVTILFIALVDHGLQSAGMGGFILSLVPSTAIFVIGLCVNREIAVNFYHNVFASSSASGSTNEKVNHAADARPANVTVKNATETTALIQVDDNEEEH